jgi:hypothetical protein
MNSNSEWPSVVRVVWIAGGIVALNESGDDVQINVGMGGRSLCTLRISTFASLFEVLRQKGFPILGTTFLMHHILGFFSDIERMTGKREVIPR